MAIMNLGELENVVAEFHDTMYRMVDHVEALDVASATSEFDIMRTQMEEMRVYLTALETMKEKTNG